VIDLAEEVDEPEIIIATERLEDAILICELDSVSVEDWTAEKAEKTWELLEAAGMFEEPGAVDETTPELDPDNEAKLEEVTPELSEADEEGDTPLICIEEDKAPGTFFEEDEAPLDDWARLLDAAAGPNWLEVKLDGATEPYSEVEAAVKLDDT
jgi:hypothetical protein